MKKFAVVSLSLLVLLSMVLCPAFAAEKVKLTMATGSVAATYYPLGGAMATVLNPILEKSELTVTATGASKANLQLMEDGDCQIGIVQNDVAFYCYKGTQLFEGETPYTGFSAVCSLYDETVQIFSLNPEFKTFTDLKGKTVSVGAAGSGDNFNASQIFEEFGMAFSDVNAVYQSYADSAESIKDGKIDAAFCVSGAPTVALVDFAATAGKPINIISLEENHIEGLMKAYPFYAKTVIPAGLYKGLDRDVTTVAIRAQLVVRNDVPEDVVYELLDAMFKNTDALKAGHGKFAGFSIDTARYGVSVPYHPGAVKFFADKGIAVK